MGVLGRSESQRYCVGTMAIIIAPRRHYEPITCVGRVQPATTFFQPGVEYEFQIVTMNLCASVDDSNAHRDCTRKVTNVAVLDAGMQL
jgi:hypothetical protein